MEGLFIWKNVQDSVPMGMLKCAYFAPVLVYRDADESKQTSTYSTIVYMYFYRKEIVNNF